MKTQVILAAGGQGTRLKAEVPKPLVKLDKKPLFIYALEVFEKCRLIESVIVVCPRKNQKQFIKAIGSFGLKKVVKVIPGGKQRRDSVNEGLQVLDKDTHYVLIHDAVRPFVDERMIKEVLEGAEEAGAATTAIQSSDTVVISENDRIKNIPERDTVKRVQTPQGFKYSDILKAHEEALEKGITGCTDDCGLILVKGGPVKIVNGSPENIKITNKLDLTIAEGQIRE